MSVPWYLMAKGKGGGYKTASGPIVSISDALAAPLRALRVGIDPVQDLHGYDAPWPAGGGVNKWDEEWELGVWSGTGEKSNSDTAIRCKNRIKVTPSTQYYIVFPVATFTRGMIVREIASDYSVVKTDTPSTSGTITTTATTEYLVFCSYAADNVTTYSNNIAINYPATATTYAPYSNECPISGWDAANVWRTGKNMLDPTDYLINADSNYNKSVGTTLVFGSSGASVSGTNPIEIAVTTNWRGVTFFTEPLKTETTYHLRYRITAPTKGNIKRSLYWVDEDNKVVEKVSFSSGVDLDVDHVYHAATTPPADGLRMAFVVVSSTQQTITIYDMGVMVGDWEVYAPYTGNQFTIQLGQTVYGGTLDVLSGVLTVTHGKVLLPSAGWTYYQTAGKNTFNIAISGCKEQGTGLCDRYAYSDTTYIANQPDKSFILYRQNVSTVKISICDNDYTDASVFGDSVEGAELVYPLATPITIPLSDITISTLAGQNVVWGDCGDVALEYLSAGGANPDLMKLAVAFMGR